MFDSAYTDYKITNTPYKKDIVAMLAEACHREKMPIGFYYSPPDMNHPAFRDTSKPASTNWNGEPTRAVWPNYLDYMELQLRELLTRYGDICLIWFDGLYNQRKYDGDRMLCGCRGASSRESTGAKQASAPSKTSHHSLRLRVRKSAASSALRSGQLARSRCTSHSGASSPITRRSSA